MTKAIAKQRGYYPSYEGGPNRIVEEGETFELVGKLTKAKWFAVIPDKPKKAETEPQKPDTPLT